MEADKVEEQTKAEEAATLREMEDVDKDMSKAEAEGECNWGGITWTGML